MPQFPHGFFLWDEEGETHMYLLVRDEHGQPIACEHYGKVDSRQDWLPTGVASAPPASIDPALLTRWMRDGKERAKLYPRWKQR